MGVILQISYNNTTDQARGHISQICLIFTELPMSLQSLQGNMPSHL